MSATDYPKLNLGNLAKGAAIELFERELAKVTENIEDVNTEATTARKITLEVKITPAPARDMAQVEVVAKSKLAGVKPAGSAIFFGRRDGKLVALNSSLEQAVLDFEDTAHKEQVDPKTGEVITLPRNGGKHVG